MRKTLIHRPTYTPEWPQEQFIVPLLEKYIQGSINKYAIPNSANARVLDVGCGRQPFRKDLESIGYQYFGLDVHQNVENNVDIIAEIDKALPNQYDNIDTFDFILCTEVLEHVAEWDMAFHNFAKLTKKEGKVLITCPHFYQLHEEPYDFWRPTPYVLEFYAKKFGFAIVEQIKAGDAWDVLGTAIANIGNPYQMKPLSLKYKIIFRLITYLKKWLLKNLINRNIQTHIGIHSPLYLSNIIILQKI